MIAFVALLVAVVTACLPERTVTTTDGEEKQVGVLQHHGGLLMVFSNTTEKQVGC